MVQCSIKIQIILAVLSNCFLFLLVSCNSTVPSAQSLQQDIVENIDTYSYEKALYQQDFEWDTLPLAGTNCNMYRVKNTHKKSKSLGNETEHLSVVVCYPNEKYILRKCFWPRMPFIVNSEDSNFADLALFINHSDSENRILQAGSIIDFHYHLNNTTKCINNVDTILLKAFKSNVINKNISSNFCSNVFSDALHDYFFGEAVPKEKLLIAYFFDNSITSYWVWRNGKNGYWHIFKKEFDANNYFLDKARSYNCPY